MISEAALVNDSRRPGYYIGRVTSTDPGMKILDDRSSAVPPRTSPESSILVVDDEGREVPRPGVQRR